MLTTALLSLVAATGSVGATGSALTTQDYDPPVRVWLNKRDARMGEEVSAYIETETDGYVVVLHAEPDGRVRVLFPIDPRYDNYVRGDDKIEIRGRGDRRTFRVYAAEGVGQVYAAYSRDPFDFSGFVRGDHWDYSIPDLWRVVDDAEAELTDIVHQMASGSYFDYDLVGYDVYRTYAYTGSRVSVGLHVGSYPRPFGYHYGYGFSCSRWGLRVGAFSYRSGCYDPFYYDPFYYGSYYDPFYYDPFFYDPFYYRSVYYRPYYYRPTVVYVGGVRAGRGRIIERYTFKSPDERFRTTDTRRRLLGENTANRRIPTVSSGRVAVSSTRQNELSTRRRVAPTNTQSVTTRRKTPVNINRRGVTEQAEKGLIGTATDRRRTPTVRSNGQSERRTPEATTTDRRRTPTNSARPADSRTPTRAVKPETPSSRRATPARTPTRSATPARTPTRRATPTTRTAKPSTPRRATVERSSVRVTRPTSRAPSRSARPSTSSSRRPTVSKPSSSSRRPTASKPSSSSRRPTVSRPSSSSRRPAVSRPSSSSRRPAVSKPSSSSRRPAVSRSSTSRSRPAARPARSAPSRSSASRSSGSSRRSTPQRSSGSGRKP